MSRLNWDDLRLLLALERQPSMRAAAEELGINHTTLSRRLAAAEESLGLILVERAAGAHRLSEGAKRFVALAEETEGKLLSLDLELSGKDVSLDGDLRISVAGPLGYILIKDELAKFQRDFPMVTLRVDATNALADLHRREADVVMRFTSGELQGDLVGRKICDYARAGYCSHAYLEQHPGLTAESGASWLGWDEDEERPWWLTRSNLGDLPIGLHLPDMTMQVEAVASGMGIGILASGIADLRDDLVRVTPVWRDPPIEVWLLTHPDLRGSARVKAFTDSIFTQLKAKRDLLEGERSLHVWDQISKAG